MRLERVKRLTAARQPLALLLAVCAVLAIAACSAPPLNTLPLRPEEDHHVLLLNQTVTITFTNRSPAGVTVAGIEWDPRGQTIFEVPTNGCIATIAANGTCTLRIRKIREGNVNVWLYLGNANRRPLGGVIVR
ncbi:MAG TPA: hypothetical protein VFF79_08510 [Conexibacter sp.]|nr:hypothetical protein [Conexibacter sp.]